MPATVRQNNLAVEAMVLDVQYLPSLPYFVCLSSAGKTVLDIHENFQKQSYRNRCRILTSQGVHELVIPLRKPTHHVPVRDIRIDNRQNWSSHHWKSICSAYGKSPWFHYYAEGFGKFFSAGFEFLCEFNLALINHCQHVLGIPGVYHLSDSYMKNCQENIFDARSLIHPKKDLRDLFFYQPAPYLQSFGVNFVSNLSIIDLLFNEGPESGLNLARCYMPVKQ